MALIMETGTASGQKDLLDKLNTFMDTNAATNGWTKTAYILEGGVSSVSEGSLASERCLTLRKGTACYFHAMSLSSPPWAPTRPRIALSASTGFTSGNNALNQTSGGYGGNSLNSTDWTCVAVPVATSFDYWFHFDSDYLICTLAMAGGYYQHWVFGQLVDRGGQSNGFFVHGSAGGGGVNTVYDFDSATKTGNCLTSTSPFGVGTGDIAAGQGGRVMNHAGSWVELAGDWQEGGAFAHFNLSSVNSGTANANFPKTSNIFLPPSDVGGSVIQSPLLPIWLAVPHSSLSGRFCLLGRVPGAWYINIENIVEEQSITIGADDYLVFPAGKTKQVDHGTRYVGVAILTP